MSDILGALRRHHFTNGKWFDVGLILGITQPKLDTISRGGHDADDQLRKCLTLWLKQDYKVEEKGRPSWIALSNALRSVGEVSVAEGINKDS